MAKYLAQMVILGTQVVVRAFTRALRQEYAASQTAANQRRSNNGSNDRTINAKTGMSLQEAMQILNVDNTKITDLDRESILKSYNHLFDVNDKSKGGSFYIQSKVVRAKERIEEEVGLKDSNDSQQEKSDSQQQQQQQN